MRFTLTIAGDKQIDREMLRMASFAGDAAPAFEAIAEDMMKVEEKQFETEGKRSSGGWEPLADSTIRRKAAEGLDPRILHATLALRKSLTERGNTDQLLIITPSTMAFGSHVPYAAVHQNPKPGNPLPQRRPIEFTEVDRRRYIKMLQSYIRTGTLIGARKFIKK